MLYLCPNFKNLKDKDNMLFIKNLINNTKQIMKKEFLKDNRIWVITFSGGKDSTTILHLTIEILLELPKKQRKKIFIFSA